MKQKEEEVREVGGEVERNSAGQRLLQEPAAKSWVFAARHWPGTSNQPLILEIILRGNIWGRVCVYPCMYPGVNICLCTHILSSEGFGSIVCYLFCFVFFFLLPAAERQELSSTHRKTACRSPERPFTVLAAHNLQHVPDQVTHTRIQL